MWRTRSGFWVPLARLKKDAVHGVFNRLKSGFNMGVCRVSANGRNIGENCLVELIG